jgi:serine/threonine-protein kinase
LTAAAATVLAALLVIVLWRSRAVGEAHQLDMNASIASGQAGAALFQLRTFADRVESAARDPLVLSLLAGGRVVEPAPPELAPLATGFDSLFLVNNEGRVLADWPATAPEVFQRNYAFRDYFRGARKLAESGVAGAYVARAYRSESRKRLEFAISAPVRGASGAQLGLVVAPFQAKAAFGGVRIQDHDSGSERIITALLGPRGNERGAGPDGVTPSDFTFLVHPGLDRGAEFTLAAPTPARLRDAFGPAAQPGDQFVLQIVQPLKIADFRDPIPGFGGRWLAAFAPVGQTGFVVMVATARDTERPWSRLWRLFHTADQGK